MKHHRDLCSDLCCSISLNDLEKRMNRKMKAFADGKLSG